MKKQRVTHLARYYEGGPYYFGAACEGIFARTTSHTWANYKRVTCKLCKHWISGEVLKKVVT